MDMYNILDHIEVHETSTHGKSLFAKHAFKKDDIVFVASGKIVNYPTQYTIPIDQNLFIEPRTPKGNPVQYICHSCDPNLGIKSSTLFVAMRNIKAGEELFVHYGFLGYEFGKEMSEDGKETVKFDLTCHCGASNCVGRFRGHKEFTLEERTKWKGYISDYLLTKKFERPCTSGSGKTSFV